MQLTCILSAESPSLGGLVILEVSMWLGGKGVTPNPYIIPGGFGNKCTIQDEKRGMASTCQCLDSCEWCCERRMGRIRGRASLGRTQYDISHMSCL